jgi:hypothetical protein
MTTPRRWLTVALLAPAVVLLIMLALVVQADARAGVAPNDVWACPASHPIKGYVSQESGRRVYFMPGTRFYEEASPERCYATESEAQRDGSRPARESPAAPPDRLSLEGRVLVATEEIQTATPAANGSAR